jgi:hypothetical protein
MSTLANVGKKYEKSSVNILPDEGPKEAKHVLK